MNEIIEVVCAVMVRDGRVLCMRRKGVDATGTRGHYEFPGGKIEPGETPEAALEREISEEMEWRVTVERHLGTAEATHPQRTIRLMAYRCGVPAVDDFTLHDHDSYRWCLPHELTTLEWSDADRQLVNTIDWDKVIQE